MSLAWNKPLGFWKVSNIGLEFEIIILEIV